MEISFPLYLKNEKNEINKVFDTDTIEIPCIFEIKFDLEKKKNETKSDYWSGQFTTNKEKSKLKPNPKNGRNGKLNKSNKDDTIENIRQLKRKEKREYE